MLPRVTATSGLIQVGTIAARGDILEPEEVHTVLTVGLFDIGGLRVAADAIGLTVVGHVSVETHGPARRFVESRFPGTTFVEQVEDVTLEEVKKWACAYSQVSLEPVPRVKGVSGLNADRKGALKDHRSCLFSHVGRVHELLTLCFPWAQVHRLMESVASMDPSTGRS